MGRVAAPVNLGKIPVGQQAILDQLIQINKVGVARKGGAALVGTVGITGGADRQDLPDRLPGGSQEIHKLTGGCAHAADAITARQAGKRHKNTAATCKTHLLSFFSFASIFNVLFILHPGLPKRPG